jgi:hypothetical protein
MKHHFWIFSEVLVVYPNDPKAMSVPRSVRMCEWKAFLPDKSTSVFNRIVGMTRL